MVATAFVLLALLVAVPAVRGGARADPRGAARALVLLALGALALRLLLELGSAPWAAPFHAPALALAAPAALATWAAIARLAAHRPRRRDLFLRAPFALLALLLALAHTSWGAVATLVLPATWAWRWRDGLPTLRLLRLAIAALLLTVALGWRLSPATAAVTASPALRELRMVAEWARVVALFHVALAAPLLLLAFLRDPSLGIRTVGRRLAASHVMAALVPLALTLAMWVLTTWLGVGADRALLAVRQLDAEGEGIAAALTAALDSGSDARPALRALARQSARERPGTREWLRADGRLERLHGAAVPDEEAIAAWADSAWRLRRSGIVELGGARWFGATAHASADSTRRAVLLAPLDEVLGGRVARVVGARLGMGTNVASAGEAGGLAPADSAEVAAAISEGTGRLAPGDSLKVARALAAARALGMPDSSLVVEEGRRPGVRLTVGRDTLRGTTARGVGMTGNAMVTGLRHERRWRMQRFLLDVQVPFRESLAGMWANLRENPLGAVPLAVLVALTGLVLLVALFDFVMVRNMARSITGAIAGLRGGTAALARGDLAHRIPIGGRDDLWDAARAFNQMAEDLERARELEKEAERLESELALARRIQARLLPSGPPAVPGLEIAGLTEPAREVGGDYFDHIPLGDGRVLLVIADVSGKGVGAALLMSGFRASLMSQDCAATPPDALAGRLNDFLLGSVDPGKFVTAFVAFLDGATGRMVYANCGHNPPVLLRADGTHEMLTRGGLILGILPGSRFESGEAVLAPGDLAVLYTDGVTEGADATGEQWGEERLLATLRERRGHPCAALVRGIAADVRAFEGERGPADDITLLAARRL